MRAQNVMDNLIYRREIPVMIGVFINPGRTPEQPEPTPQAAGATASPIAPHRIQHAGRQVRARDHRRADAGAVQGVQHFEGPGAARHRRLEFRRDRRVHGGLGAAQRFPQGAEQRRQLRRICAAATSIRSACWRARRSRSASSCATAATTIAASARMALTTRSATGSTRTCG